MKGILKWPLVLSAFVVVARVVLERLGAPVLVSSLFSSVVLHVLILPLYFAVRIAIAGIPHPYRTQLKITALYAALTRSMVIVTYWLAYIYQWPEGRFSTSQGGNVGTDVTPLFGFIVIPFGAGLAWVVGSVIIGGGLGCVVLALWRWMAPAPQSTRN